MHLVIGSGPSGVAAAAALLEQGCRVHMLDAGLQLEPPIAEAVERARVSAAPWLPEISPWHAASAASAQEKIPEKLVYGSDYPFREAEERLGIARPQAGLRPSMGLGGLSAVWGAAIAPYRDADIANWPITMRDLAPHYEAALRLTGVAAQKDDLDEILPLYAAAPSALRLSRQAAAMAKRMSQHRAQLRRAGIHFGSARAAIRVSQSADAAEGCSYCGMCLSGCPYRHIYNAEQTLASLRKSERFSYQNDVVITTVEEAAQGAVARGYDRLSGAPISVEGARLFLACGVLSTTAILLRSLGAYDRTLHIRDSQYFLLPAILLERITNVEVERLYTLSQLFVEIDDAAISPHLVHVQVYAYNSLIAARVRKTLGPLAEALGGALAREMMGRLIVMQGYLHSAHSSRIAVTLCKTGASEMLDVTPEINPLASRLVAKVTRKLLRHGLELGAIAVPPMTEIAEPGRGFHSGGSFPMRESPQSLETDTFGRPAGWQRVHAVDATVLPSIAATTITLTVMANAHRIASLSANME
ncbi:MAG: hypothetical protein WAW96_21505 [Alphaproteobacteria bacterium]